MASRRARARALALELARAEVSDQTRGEARARRGKQSLAEVRGGVRAERRCRC